VIPLGIFNEMVARPEIRFRFNPDPFSAAMQSVMGNCAKFVRDHRASGDRIAFVCDDGPNSHLLAGAYVDFKRKNPWISHLMEGLVHLDDRRTPQLQAADMVPAWAKTSPLNT